MPMVLTDEKKGLVFKMLRDKPIYETGLEFGFDKYYKDAVAVKNAVYRIYSKVKVEPERYGINPEVADEISSIMTSRQVIPSQNKSLREKNDELAKVDLKDLLINSSQKAIKLVNMKLDDISSSKKKMEAINIVQLTTAFGTLFDKSQIIQGQATENIAVLAKVDSDMSPEDALSAVLKVRESHQVEKERVKKK